MTQNIDVKRADVIEVVNKVLGPTGDPNLIPRLFSAAAYAFAYPETLNKEETELLQRAYRQLAEKGYI